MAQLIKIGRKYHKIPVKELIRAAKRARRFAIKECSSDELLDELDLVIDLAQGRLHGKIVYRLVVGKHQNHLKLVNHG